MTLSQGTTTLYYCIVQYDQRLDSIELHKPLRSNCINFTTCSIYNCTYIGIHSLHTRRCVARQLSPPPLPPNSQHMAVHYVPILRYTYIHCAQRLSLLKYLHLRIVCIIPIVQSILRIQNRRQTKSILQGRNIYICIYERDCVIVNSPLQYNISYNGKSQ